MSSTTPVTKINSGFYLHKWENTVNADQWEAGSILWRLKILWSCLFVHQTVVALIHFWLPQDTFSCWKTKCFSSFLLLASPLSHQCSCVYLFLISLPKPNLAVAMEDSPEEKHCLRDWPEECGTDSGYLSSGQLFRKPTPFGACRRMKTLFSKRSSLPC